MTCTSFTIHLAPPAFCCRIVPRWFPAAYYKFQREPVPPAQSMMHIGQFYSHVEGNAAIVSAPIQTGSDSFELQYTMPPGALTNRVDPLIAAALLPAMKVGQPLQVAGTASQKLLRALPTIQDIFASWDPSLNHVSVQVQSEGGAQFAGTRGVASFFTGGVDSFYTALKHRNEIDALIFVHGFDIAIEDRDIQMEVSRSLRQAAEELGKPLIEVRTNLRSFLKPHIPWEFAYGAGLASVALFLAPFFRKIYIASSFSYGELIPCGSHPLLDPLWSSEDMELVHDGSETTRGCKNLAIATSETALRHLRVCPLNRGAAMNCGRCGKCLRAMIWLHLAGVLERCPTFAQPLDPDAIARTDLPDAAGRIRIHEVLKALETRSDDRPLVEALHVVLRRADDQIIEQQKNEIVQLRQILTSTQAWARELEAAAIARDHEIERLKRTLSVRVARRVRRVCSR